jgi:hypothetical protein
MPKRKKHRKNTERIGLASAKPETKSRVAKAGGLAPHKSRGLQAVGPERRKEISKMGGQKRWEETEKLKPYEFKPMNANPPNNTLN